MRVKLWVNFMRILSQLKRIKTDTDRRRVFQPFEECLVKAVTKEIAGVIRKGGRKTWSFPFYSFFLLVLLEKRYR